MVQIITHQRANGDDHLDSNNPQDYSYTDFVEGLVAELAYKANNISYILEALHRAKAYTH